ncbi:uncharacterized protein BDCG_06086 [Blastomyces dermatitidis ER-3]|uniref:Uncharacterized protein n=3 Tax=Blastomyces TaxID=229219 RepID=A0A179URR0_BLAGS|nr:uncharacterized protein BDBG_06533 [Blastomyces gilchristii SLH14081]XP_045277596.1 uncharacterized protein BDCG_06086 [Blastomyces dermatitidis ER-3]EEQ90966.2 hypothetical protein BDCG_06086 [Blastomyces dermatitidis ER-3]EQL36046.1 hypothetical protein BDFG_02309 [Blastomyces dermatitidis ATCC 26199]OAT10724.1 hypothetical protein BDBG_06533 [Blastomyces gilchristii SLH14081]
MKSSPLVRRTASPSSKNMAGPNGEIVDRGVAAHQRKIYLSWLVLVWGSAPKRLQAPDMVYRHCQGRGWLGFPFLKKASLLLQDFADQMAWFIR